MVSRRLAAYAVAIGSAAFANGQNSSSTEGTVHVVTVGKGGHSFEPSSVKANVGDIISFEFYPLNHSVIRSTYGYPCIPIEDLGGDEQPFFSGFQPVPAITDDMPTWNLTINNTDPVWYYCGAPGSCTGFSMLGVINPNDTTSLEIQMELAKEADYMLLPGEPFPSEDQYLSMSEMAHTATVTQNIVTTATPAGASSSSRAHAHQDHSSGLSTGAVAGIAVGAAVAALVVAALFFLLCRTRGLKKKLDAQKAETQAATKPEASPMSPTAAYGNYYDQVRQSHLPPYQPYPSSDAYYQDANKPRDTDSWVSDQTAGRTLSPSMHQHHFSGLSSPEFNQQRFSHSTTSELVGNTPAMVELEAARNHK